MLGSSDTAGPRVGYALSARARRVWLAVLFFVGLGYLAVLPPFHAIDEPWHWDRIWTVAQGQYNCVSLPNAAGEFAQKTFRGETDPLPTPIPWASLIEARDFVGVPGSFLVGTAACGYPPIGYLPAALAVRLLYPRELLEPQAGKMFYSFYASRIANWLFFFACVVAALRVARYPFPVLLFASIPQVIQQSAVLNNDAVQFGCLLVSGALLTAEPSRRRIWIAIALIALVSAIKPINAIASLLVLPALLLAAREGAMGRREAWIIAAVGALLPVVAWLVWHGTMYISSLGNSTDVPIAGVNEAAQREFVREHPFRLVQIVFWQLKQLFTEMPVHGGWRGILFVYGWCRYQAPDYVYALIWGSIGCGAALLRSGHREGVALAGRLRTLFLAALTVACLGYFTVVTYALYLGFTPVAHPAVFGVQGRYFLYAIGVVLFVYPIVRTSAPRLSERAARSLRTAFFGLSLSANVAALWTILRTFWQW